MASLQPWTPVNHHQAGQTLCHTVAGAPTVSAPAAGIAWLLLRSPPLSYSGGRPSSVGISCSACARSLLCCRSVGPAAAG